MKPRDSGTFLTDPEAAVAHARFSHAIRIKDAPGIALASVPQRWRNEDLWAEVWGCFRDPSGNWRARVEAVAYRNPYDRLYTEAAILDYRRGSVLSPLRDVMGRRRRGLSRSGRLG